MLTVKQPKANWRSIKFDWLNYFLYIWAVKSRHTKSLGGKKHVTDHLYGAILILLRVFVLLDHRTSALILVPPPLGPNLVGPRSPKYCKNKFMNKTYYLFKIILIRDYSRLTIILIQDIQKAIWKGQAMVSKINGKVFHHSSFFSSITKKRKKNFMVKWNTFIKLTTLQLFLNIQTCSCI